MKRAAGLGSARTGVEHWWIQRVTAVVLIPAVIWLLTSLIAHISSDYTTVITWLERPAVTIVMVVLLLVLFWHMALGLRVVIEDYVHVYAVKIAAVFVVEVICLLLAIAGIYATLAIAFQG